MKGFIGFTLSCWIVSAAAGADVDYSFTDQFSTSSNPAGVWSYGYAPRGAGFILFSANYNGLVWGESCFFGGPPPSPPSGPPCDASVFYNDGSNGIINLVNIGAPAVGLSRGFGSTNLAVLRFTAPSNGQYRIRIKAWTPWAFEQAQTMQIRVNGSLVFSNMFVSDFVVFTNSVSLAVGQTIDMVGSDHNQISSSRNNIIYLQGGVTLLDTNYVPPAITFVPAPGLFTNSVTVQVSNNTTNGVIRLTKNGSNPTASSPLYEEPPLLTNATDIRAALFDGASQISQVFTGAYSRVYAVNDGIPASWREQYFGPGYLTDPRVSADADPDGDLSTNREEYLAGTNPLDPASGFKATVTAVPMVRFATVIGRSYRLLRRDHVNAAPTVVTTITATGTMTTYVDTSVTASMGIYMVELLP